MNKYSYISLVLAFVAGIIVGVLYSNKQYRTDLNQLSVNYADKIDSVEHRISKLDSILSHKDSTIAELSGKIDTLNTKLKKSKVKTQTKREEARRLNSNEKEKWLTARYNSLPNLKKDSVTVSDTVAARVIDDLILKDGLEYDNMVKDTIILTYETKDSTYQEVIAIHKAKEAEQDTIISFLKQSNHDLINQSAQEKKQHKKEKLKLKLLVIGETILIILLLL